MKNFKEMFEPRSIAIVGASSKKEKLGNVLLQNLKRGGWKGKIYPVNPNYKKIGNLPCFASLKEIKKPVDLALIAIPAPFVNQVIEDGCQANPEIKNYVVISSGFRESGREGKKMEERMSQISEEKKINILGPNCLGFINPYENLNATFFTRSCFKKGKVSLVSQSGALAVAFLDWIENFSLGFSKIITVGNKAAFDECDALEYLSADKNTQAIALYLEDIKNGARFLETALRVGKLKPFIILKAGKTKTGQKAIDSHTGSLAQDEKIVEAVFEKTNIITAQNTEEFQDLILFFSTQKYLSEKKVIIITNAGGPGVLASDFIGKSNILSLAKIDPQTKNKLQKILPPSASFENPIDLIGDATPDRYEKVLRLITKKYSQNPVFLILTPQAQTDPDAVSHIAKKYKNSFASLSACFMGGEKVQNAKKILIENGIPNFESPERALLCFEKTILFATEKDWVANISKPKKIHLNLENNALIQKALEEKRHVLLWQETSQIFRSFGISLVETIIFQEIKGLQKKKIPFPCVLKTDDPKIIHRWGKNGIVLNIQSQKELFKAYNKIKKMTAAKNFLIQPLAKKGLEMIVGLKRDINFGPVVVIGGGGIFTEIFRDRILLVAPFSKKEILKKINKLMISPLLKGFRGERKYNIEEISQIALALQDIATQNPDISQIDINPVILYNNKEKCRIVDVKTFL